VTQDREKLKQLYQDIGGDPLQVLTIRRYRETVQLRLPALEDDSAVWYFYANDTINVGKPTAASLRGTIMDNAGDSRLRILRSSADEIVLITVMEANQWLYGHRLHDLCRLPGLPESFRLALEQVKEETA